MTWEKMDDFGRALLFSEGHNHKKTRLSNAIAQVSHATRVKEIRISILEIKRCVDLYKVMARCQKA